MPNITIHLDDETHRLAKIHAAQTGSSLSSTFRNHIRGLMNVGSNGGERAVLERYSRLEISAKDAMAALEMQCLESLLAATVAAGLHLPRIDRKSAMQMVKSAPRLVRTPSHA